jgi:serine/threonine-protein kinase
VLNFFREEGRLLERLVHPNIVRTLEVGADENHSYIAMELLLGATFAQIHDAIAAQGKRIPPELAAWALARVAAALHFAHELTDDRGAPLGIIHRDVNPANVFGTFAGDVKLFDFGLVKMDGRVGIGKSSPNLVAGKLAYLSPEQIMQLPIDRRSDVFTLGTTLWELLTARRLFRRESDAETLRAVHIGPIPDPREVAPEVPPELARIAKKALERNREHRYATAQVLGRELDAYVAQKNVSDAPKRLADLIVTLFPGEQKRQKGWLKPAVTPTSRSSFAPVGAPAGPLSTPPRPPPKKG